MKVDLEIVKFNKKWQGLATIGALSLLAIGLVAILPQEKVNDSVKAGREEVKNLPTVENPEVKEPEIGERLGTVGEKTDPAYASIMTLIEQQGYQGTVLLVRDGKAVWQQGFGEMSPGKAYDPDAPIALTSISKNVTAYLLEKELTRKKMSLDTSLAEFYPNLPGATETTLRDLVRMDAPYKGIGYAENEMSEQEYTAYYLQNMTYQAKPEKWKYNATNYQILTGVLQKLTNKSYDELVAQDIKPNYQILTVDEFAKADNRPTAINREGNAKSFNPQRFKREVGTGNSFMSAWETYRFISDEIQGVNLTTAEFADLTKPREGKKNGYVAGMYKRDYGYQLHGELQSFEPSIFLDNTGQNGVVLFSNRATGDIDDDLGKPIFDIWMTMK